MCIRVLEAFRPADVLWLRGGCYLPRSPLGLRGAALEAYPAAALVVGVSPGVRACEDRGYRYPERLFVGGLEADQWLSPEGVCGLELARATGEDEALRILEAELAEAVRSVAPEVVFRSDRGPDTASPRSGANFYYSARCCSVRRRAPALLAPFCRSSSS